MNGGARQRIARKETTNLRVGRSNRSGRAKKDEKKRDQRGPVFFHFALPLEAIWVNQTRQALAAAPAGVGCVGRLRWGMAMRQLMECGTSLAVLVTVLLCGSTALADTFVLSGGDLPRFFGPPITLLAATPVGSH